MTLRQPVFILCPGRSFSSVVCAAIGQHPEMFGLPEVNLFVRPDLGSLIDLDVPFVGLPNILIGLRRAIAELEFGGQTEETVRQANRWMAERRDWTGAQVFEALREMAGGRALVDKTPTNSQNKPLQALHQAYPDAFYLHLARHPRATARSRAQATSQRKQSFAIASRGAGEADLEKLWVGRHASLVAFGHSLRPEQYMYLKGELFLEDPESILRQICEWVGVSTDPDAIAAMMRPEESPFASYGPENAKLGNNAGFIEAPELRVGKPREENLDDPLEWVEDRTAYFDPRTRLLAAALGYGD